MSAAALATQPDTGLHGRLDALVRLEFRVDVLVPAVGDPILGTPACEVTGCVHSSRYRGLCLAHLRRWKLDGRPDRRAWAASADPAVMGHRPLQPCRVIGCGYGQGGAALTRVRRGRGADAHSLGGSRSRPGRTRGNAGARRARL